MYPKSAIPASASADQVLTSSSLALVASERGVSSNLVEDGTKVSEESAKDIVSTPFVSEACTSAGIAVFHEDLNTQSCD